MPSLLVSVQTPSEARSAWRGGCHVLDFKAPAHGPLGRPDRDTIRRILHELDTCEIANVSSPDLSLALGELREWDEPLPIDPLWNRLQFLKAGNAGIDSWPDWADRLQRLQSRFHRAGVTAPQWIACWYAEDFFAETGLNGAGLLASAPDFAAWLLRIPVQGVLIDTRDKQGPGLAAWLLQDSPAAGSLCQQFLNGCRRAGLLTALAGRLTADEISRLLAHGYQPNYIGVRSAACPGHHRDQTVSEPLVAQLSLRLKANFA